MRRPPSRRTASAPSRCCATRLIARFESLGRIAPAEADIDVLLNAFEYVGYRVALSVPGDETTVDWARTTMARLAIGLLGTTSDVERALTIPGLLRTAD